MKILPKYHPIKNGPNAALFLLCCFLFPAALSAQSVIISEVVDPGDVYQARYVEIYNATSNPVDISGWQIRRYANGGNTSCDATIPASTTLASGNTYTIAYNATDFNNEYSCSPDMASGCISGNGDDVYELFDGASVIDVYGEVGVDGTGQAWEYEDAIATRNSTVCSGNTTWTSSEWTISGGNTGDATPCSHNASCSSNTTVQFSQSQDSVAENGGSYNISVSISNPDGSNSTSADVVLTSGDAANLGGYTTQTVTFPAGSSSDETVTLTITDNTDCIEDSTYVFELQNVSGGNSATAGSPSQFTLVVTDDEFSGQTLESKGWEGNGWNYSTSVPPCQSGGDTWDSVNTLGSINPASGSWFWGIEDLNGDCGGSNFESIDFQQMNLSGYENVQISFKYHADGFDTGDDIKYEVYHDGTGQGEVVVVDGVSNYSTSGWETETVSVPNSVTNVSISIRVRQNGSDQGGIDDVIISGDGCGCSVPTISGFSPSQGSVGTTVTINGSGFNSGSGTSDVQFNGTSASFTVVSNSQIDATVPSGASTGQITVLTDGCSDITDTDFLVTFSKTGLVVNEMSNGPSGDTKEYVELVVVGDTCSTVDLRGMIVDDNNGEFSNGPGTGEGIATGFIRFDDVAAWQSVPTGSLILIYNDGNKNTNIPADDPTDSNTDSIYILPANNSNLSSYEVRPNSSDGTYFPSGTQNTGSWGELGLRNGGDAMQTRAPDSTYYHGISYGDIDGGPDNLMINTGGGSDMVYYFNSGDFRNAGNFSSGTVSGGDETPGDFNNAANQAWVESFRCSSTLPIELTTFEAHHDQASSHVNLTWVTASETNNDYFTILRSEDGQKFKPILKRDGAGNSSSKLQYYATDKKPLPGVSYYRLKQTDFDGKTSLSSIQAVEVKTKETLGIKKAFKKNDRLVIQYNSPSEPAQLQVIDQVGKVHYSERVQEGHHLHTLPSSIDLNSGFYLIRLSNSTGVEIKKTPFLK